MEERNGPGIRAPGRWRRCGRRTVTGQEQTMFNRRRFGAGGRRAPGADGRARRIRKLAAPLVATALLASGGCKKAEDKNAYAPPPPPEVIVAHPIERDVTTYLFYTGTIEASETVDLR